MLKDDVKDKSVIKRDTTHLAVPLFNPIVMRIPSYLFNLDLF